MSLDHTFLKNYPNFYIKRLTTVRDQPFYFNTSKLELLPYLAGDTHFAHSSPLLPQQMPRNFSPSAYTLPGLHASARLESANVKINKSAKPAAPKRVLFFFITFRLFLFYCHIALPQTKHPSLPFYGSERIYMIFFATLMNFATLHSRLFNLAPWEEPANILL